MIARILSRIGAWLGAPTLDDYAAASPGAEQPPALLIPAQRVSEQAVNDRA